MVNNTFIKTILANKLKTPFRLAVRIKYVIFIKIIFSQQRAEEVLKKTPRF